MPLPKIEIEYRPFKIEGVGEVRMRPLSRDETMERIKDAEEGDPSKDEVIDLLTLAIDASDEEISEWIGQMPFYLALRVFEFALDLSKSGPEAAIKAARGN